MFQHADMKRINYKMKFFNERINEGMDSRMIDFYQNHSQERERLP